MAYQHRTGLIRHDSTYYSFNDIELVEPPGPVAESEGHVQDSSQQSCRPHMRQEYGGPRYELSTKMQRQDSGYESCEPASPRTSMSIGGSRSGNSSRRPAMMGVARQNSSPSGKATAISAGLRSPRPLARRCARSYSIYSTGAGYQTPYKVGPYTHTSQLMGGYVQFPTPADLVELTEPPPLSSLSSSSDGSEVVTPVPQTMHYWTSDSTRRLEYAAIDAAGRGVKGWVRRHLVPDCLVPRDSRHVAFDDETGSVRRYRLQLDDEHENDDRDEKVHDLKKARRRKSWRFWRD